MFNAETFGGNGRTCSTCHLESSGAIGPDDIEAAWQDDPTGPLFRAIDSDDGTGASYDRMREDGTFRIFIDLPDNVELVDDPSATQVELFRSVSTVKNNPGFETVFMQDGRNSSLEEQALGAVNAHAEPGRQPTLSELEAVADFQFEKRRFYTSTYLWQKAQHGQDPVLPTPTTPEEIRGAAWFDGTRPEGACAHCHNGPFMNETNQFHLVPGVPVGTRFFSAFVSEFNTQGSPVQTFAFYDPANPTAAPTIITSPDPGRALITGDPADANAFRIPTVWGAKHSAPYFHDNSAADLQELMDHYQAYFAIIGIPMDEQDKQDVIAYMNLLE